MSNLKKALEIILESNQSDSKFEYDNMGQIINLNKDLAKRLNLIEIEYIRKRFVSLQTMSKNNGKSYIICAAERFIVLKKVNNVNMIFYVSTGKGGKKSPAGKWYPVFGVSGGWINKANDSFIMEYYGSEILKKECEELDNKIGDIRNLKNIDPINISINDGEIQTEILNKGKNPSHEKDPVRTFKNMYTIINKIDPNNTFKNLFSKDNKEGFTLDFYNKISSNERVEFKKDLSNFNGQNPIISEILKSFDFIKGKKINDFIVTFKKESKSVIIDVNNKEYSINGKKQQDDFNYDKTFLDNVAFLIFNLL
jgi:hypothetical protein